VPAPNAPTQLQLLFAQNGVFNVIPNASQISVTPGAASYNDGFPPVTRQPVASGGVPPYGEDMNGILNALSAGVQWHQLGGGYPFSSAFATALGGYPLAAVVEAADGNGYWINGTSGNTTNPDTGSVPSGWQPINRRGIYNVTGLTNANVTLTNTQSAYDTITAAGTLTGNVVINVSPFVKSWKFINNTTGNFTVTFKPASGVGVTVPQGGAAECYGDGTNINLPAALQVGSATQPGQAVQFGQVAGVVGATRNLAMSVAAASATATLTADEIVVETALGGLRYCLASFNKTINLGATGAGGMDTGAAPAPGYVAIYAIYNPTTGTQNLLATNVTSAVAPNVYGGGNMPAGYTASALVSLWPTNSSGNLVGGYQKDRIYIGGNGAALSTTTTTSSYTSLSIASLVPKNARAVWGNASADSSGSAAKNVIQIASDANATGLAQITAYGNSSGQFRVPIATPQTIYYNLNTLSGTTSFNIGISGYEF
jgi:hypothetical protein